MKTNEIEKKIGIIFNKKDYLIEAFTHNSFVNEQKILYKKKLNSYERLEFLGDAVLDFVVTQFLYDTYNNTSEGILTKYRSMIVQGKTLSGVSRKLSLSKYILLSKGEYKSKGYDKDAILENVFEALIGAIYIDQGIDKTIWFIEKYLLSHISDILDIRNIDAKTAWQELAQSVYGFTPKYNVVSESGEDHDKIYESITIIDDVIVGRGKGKNKKLSEVSSANDALERYRKYNGILLKMKI